MTPDGFVNSLTFPLLNASALDVNSHWWQDCQLYDWISLHDTWIEQRTKGYTFRAEELNIIRNWAWGEDVGPRDAPAALDAVCRLMLQARFTGEVKLCYEPPHGQLAENESGVGIPGSPIDGWIRLTRQIPPDILCANIWQPPWDPGICPSNLNFLPPELRKTFGRESAEDYHVHWGAAFFYEDLLEIHTGISSARRAFERAWSNQGLTEEEFAETWIEMDGGYRFSPVLALVLHGLLAGLIARCIDSGSFPEGEALILCPLLYEDFYGLTFLRPQERPRGRDRWLSAVQATLDEWEEVLGRGDMALVRRRRVPDSSFLARTFTFMKEYGQGAGELSEALALATDKMLRLRCLLYAHITEQCGKPGLPTFNQWFDNMRQVRKAAPRIGLRDRAAALQRDGQINRLEIRVDGRKGPAYWLEEYAQLRSWPEAQRRGGHGSSENAESDDSGSFASTERDLFFGEVCFSLGLVKPAAEPVSEGQCEPIRHACVANTFRETVDRFIAFAAPAGAVRPRTCVLNLIRGLDVFSDERAVANWVPALAYQYFNHRVEKELGRGVQHTFHAGEDFILASEGLRMIDEAIEGANLIEGCRIGHGLALGATIEEGKVDVQLGRLVDDLVWEWDIWRKRGDSKMLDQAEHDLEDALSLLSDECRRLDGREAAETVRAIAACDPTDLLGAYKLRFDFDRLEELGLVSTRPGYHWFDNNACHRFEPNGKTELLLRVYLISQCLRTAESKGKRVTIDSSRKKRLETLRNLMAQKVRDRNLVVEMCPTSNTLIGGLAGYGTHPVFRLAPVNGTGAFQVCLCTDDPVVFNTTIQREFVYLYWAAVEAKHPPRVAADWLRDIVEMGRCHSFVRPQDDLSLRELYRSLCAV